MQGKPGGGSRAGSYHDPFAEPKANPFLPENQPNERQNYAVQAVKAPKARPQRDLKTLGFVGASQVQQARQRQQANKIARTEPKAQKAGAIKPEPLPKGFTGFTPAQERQAAKAGATRADVPGLNKLARGIKATPPTALALGKPLAQYVADLPKELATQKETKRQQEAGLFYTSLLQNIPKLLAHDVTHPGAALALDIATAATGGTQLAARAAEAARALKAANELSYVDQAAAGVRALRTPVLPQQALPLRLLGNPETGTRQFKLNDLPVQPQHQSPSILVAAAQHAFDRFSEARPGLPLVGAASRATRIIPETQMVAARRAAAELIPAQRAAKKLRNRGFAGFGNAEVSPQEAAISGIASYGHGPEGVALLDKEIARLQTSVDRAPLQIARAQRAGDTSRANHLRFVRDRQTERIKVWKAARPYVENPAATPDLQKALDLVRGTSENTQAGRIERELLDPQTAQAALSRHARIASGAVYVSEGEAAKQVQMLGRSLKRIAARKNRVKRDISAALNKERIAPEVKAAGVANHAASTASTRRSTLAAELKDLEQTERELVKTKAKLERLSSGKNLTTSDLPGLHPGRDFSGVRIRELGKTYDQSVRLQKRLDKQLGARDLMAGEQAAVPGIVQAQQDTRAALDAARQRQLDQATHGERSLASLAEAERRIAAIQAETHSGLVGAEGVTPGPGAFFQPDVERQKPTFQVNVRPRSLNRPKPEGVHQSKGVLATQSRNRLGPDVTIDDALKDIRHKEWQRQAHEAEQGSVPFDPNTYDPKKHMLLNPEGAKVPRYLTAERQGLRLEDSTVGEVAQRWIGDRTAWADELFPGWNDPAKAAQLAQEHPLGLRMLDRKVGRAMIGIHRFNALADRNILLRVLDFSNNINRAALIYLNPSYIPKNFAGNLAYLHLQQLSPFLVAQNLRRASIRMSDLSPETLDTIATEAGGGAARELAHQATGAFSKPLTKIADIQGAGADRLPRIAAWLYEADKRGFKSAQQIDQLLHQPELRPILNEVSEGAQQAMVKFSRAPNSWRYIASKAIFIFPWVEGATRYVPRLVLDRPLSARIAYGVRQRLQEYQKQVFGDATSAVPGRIPYGHPFSKYGTRVVKTINTTSLSPTGQAASVVNAIENAATGNFAAPDQLSSFIQPTAAALLEAATGTNFYNRRAFPGGQGFGNILSQELLGTTNRPGIPIASAIATALRHQPQYAGKTTLVPSAGIMAAVQQLLYGSARPGVLVNLPAATANARRRLGKKGGGYTDPFGGGSSSFSDPFAQSGSSGSYSDPFAG